MSVTVTKYPSLITGVENPVIFEFSSNHTILGVKALLVLIYEGGIDEVVGAQYVLSWGLNKTTTLTCVLNPDNSGTQFPSRQGEQFDEWLGIVVSYLKLNTVLAADFIVYSDVNQGMLVFEALLNDDLYTLTCNLVSANATVYGNTAGVDDIVKSNHLIGLRVFRRVDNVDTMISDELVTGLIVSDNLIVQFDVAEILKAHCESEVSSADKAKFTMTARNEMNPAYFIKYYEQYGGVDQTALISRWFFSLNGGIPAWKQLPFFNTYDNLTKYFTISRRYFLTWCDFAKQTDANAPEKLYLIFPSKPTPTQFVFRLTRHFFDDGDDVEDTAVHKQFYAGEVFELNVSAFNLMTPVPDNLSGYDIQFRSADGTYYSSVFSFLIDPVYHKNLRYFVYLNSLGAFECVRLFGVSSLESSYKHELINQSALSEYSSPMSPVGQNAPEVTRTVKLNTGYQSLEYCVWFQEFLASTEIYEVKTDGWYPVIVTQDKVEISRDSEYLKKISVAVVYPDHSRVYQREKVVAWSTVQQVGNPYS